MTSNNPTFTHMSALETLRSVDATEMEKLKAGSFLIQNNHYDHYTEVMGVLAQYENFFINNVEWHYCMGFGKVTKHQPEAAIPHLLRTLALIQDNPAIYRALTWAYLQIQNWAQAFLVSSAGLNNCPDKNILQSLYHLSKVRYQGHEIVEFNKNGIDYKFSLFTTNTQEIEASLYHLSQQFTEQDELSMILNHVGKVSAIAEIGCLVGNHSVFFLKNMTPSILTVIDASTTSLAHAQTNIQLNLDDSSSTQVEFIHSAVGKENGEIQFFKETVELQPLDSLLKQSYDFIKIDVDGMEMDALNGATQYIRQYRPIIMIEVLHILKNPFMEYLKTVNYQIITKVERQDYSNYLIGSN